MRAIYCIIYYRLYTHKSMLIMIHNQNVKETMK